MKKLGLLVFCTVLLASCGQEKTSPVAPVKTEVPTPITEIQQTDTGVVKANDINTEASGVIEHRGFEIRVDKNGIKQVYFVGFFATPVLIEGVDLDSFTILNSHYAKDKNHIYSPNPGGEITIKGVDMGSFQVVGDTDGYWGKDKNSVYAWGTKLDGADSKTFQAMGAGYAKDKNTIYTQSFGKIHGINPDTANIIDQNFIKDKAGLYFVSDYTVNADIGSFEIIKKDAWYRDNKHVYSFSTNGGIPDERNFVTLEGVNPEKVSISSDGYLTDGGYKYECSVNNAGTDTQNCTKINMSGGKEKITNISALSKYRN